MDDIYARFNPNPTKIAAWNQLLMLGHSSPNSSLPPPDVLYSRATPTFLHWRNILVKLGWRNIPENQLPTGLLFVVESPRVLGGDTFASRKSLSPSSSSDSICESSGSHSSTIRPTKATRLALPAELSAFLEYSEDIQESLRNPALFKPVLDSRNNLALATPDEMDQRSAAVLKDIFYLLQLIVPGMFLLVHDSLSFSEQKTPASSSAGRRSHRFSFPDNNSRDICDTIESRASPQILLCRTRRALPPAEWIISKLEGMESIFGKPLLHKLLSCARDVELTVWSTVNGPDGDPLDSGSVSLTLFLDIRTSYSLLISSDAGFEPPISPTGSWLEPEEVSGSIAIPTAPHTLQYRDRHTGYLGRAHSL